jgi:hypothetical protein
MNKFLDLVLDLTLLMVFMAVIKYFSESIWV